VTLRNHLTAYATTVLVLAFRDITFAITYIYSRPWVKNAALRALQWQFLAPGLIFLVAPQIPRNAVGSKMDNSRVFAHYSALFERVFKGFGELKPMNYERLGELSQQVDGVCSG
jgi:hypothetical protein